VAVTVDERHARTVVEILDMQAPAIMMEAPPNVAWFRCRSRTRPTSGRRHVRRPMPRRVLACEPQRIAAASDSTEWPTVMWSEGFQSLEAGHAV